MATRAGAPRTRSTRAPATRSPTTSPRSRCWPRALHGGRRAVHALTVLGVDAGLAFAEQRQGLAARYLRAKRACAKSIPPPGAPCCNDADDRSRCAGAARCCCPPATWPVRGYVRAARAAAHGRRQRRGRLAGRLREPDRQRRIPGPAQRRPARHRRPGGARRLHLEPRRRASLRGASRILFIASTYGEGDAPDTAARFAGRLMARRRPGRTCTTPCWRWATAATPITAASAARWTPGWRKPAPRRCSSASTSTAATLPALENGSST
jgi:hypothetical protein